MTKQKPVKKRNWAFIVYPESAPVDWVDILQKTGLQCAISPLHDQDVNATGEFKKAHYHVIACYSTGTTSFNVVKSLTDSLNASIPQPVEQVNGYYRYLTHKDNPEKAQYEESLIKRLNGFNIMDHSELRAGDKERIKKELQRLIRELGIVEYCDLMDYILSSGTDEEYSVASNNTYFFDKYLTSIRNQKRAS